MGDMYIKKNGLLYSPDGKTVIGVDDSANDTADKFTGTIPFGAYYVDDEVFSECPYESFSFPDSIKKIGNAQLKDSKALETVKLPAFIKELPAELFSGCSALKKVFMPNELVGFPEALFQGCESMTEIPFRAGIKVLPKNVFAGCSSLKSLVVPNTVESIEENAVVNCTSLVSVVIPSSVKLIARGAFDGCTSIHNIRLNGESDYFVIGADGSLYAKDAGPEGESTLDGVGTPESVNTPDRDPIIKAYKVDPMDVDYFEENVDDKPIEASEDEFEDNDEALFCTEIGEESEIAVDEEIEDNINEEIENQSDDLEIGASEEEAELIQGDNMSDENNVDSMLADIMGEERERTSAVSDVGVSEKESEVLSEALDVMADSNIANKGATVSTDELEKLFSKNEEQEIEAQSADEEKEFDSKTKILIDSVKKNKVLNFEPASDTREDSDLFVIAEKTVTNDDGTEGFSSHLESCCSKMARIHDFKRVIMLYGLPLDNDEFMEFYRHFIGKRNIMLACEADRPSKLSDYCNTVCENSRISLEKAELKEQRKNASVKTDNLIKLVVRDTYQ